MKISGASAVLNPTDFQCKDKNNSESLKISSFVFQP